MNKIELVSKCKSCGKVGVIGYKSRLCINCLESDIIKLKHALIEAIKDKEL